MIAEEKEFIMRCGCGQKGEIVTKRRDMPYCQACFEHHLVKSVREELRGEAQNDAEKQNRGEEKLRLKSTKNNFEAATRKLCALARREVIEDEKGAIAGCAEIAAAHSISSLFVDPSSTDSTNSDHNYNSDQGKVFPSSITFEEMQIFFKPLQEEKLDGVALELFEIENRYPGTVRSILKATKHQSL